MEHDGQLTLEDHVSGSLNETLVLRGTFGGSNLVVLFSAEILDHWPRKVQADRLNEMLPFIEAGVRRAVDKHGISDATALLGANESTALLVLGWADIAS